MRTKDVFDGATPSANAVAAMALARLGRLTGERPLHHKPPARSSTSSVTSWAGTRPPSPRRCSPPPICRRAGPRWWSPAHRPDLVDVVRRRWLPGTVLAWGEPTASPLWQDRDESFAYVCRNHTCQLPAADADTLSSQLAGRSDEQGIDPHPPERHRPGRRPRHQAAVEHRGGRWARSLTVLVLSCHLEDTTGVDLASGTLVRVRVAWPEDHGPDLSPFDVVEARLADEPERDDLAQPEAVTAEGLPRHLGTLHGRRVRRMLHRLVAPTEEHVLGFPGASAPYWEFRGFRPSLALIEPTKGPVLFRRIEDRSVWIRFGWGRSDNWLPVEDLAAERALDVARRDRLQGKDLASALGFKPHYLVAAITMPRDGHCYKMVRAVLPRS